MRKVLLIAAAIGLFAMPARAQFAQRVSWGPTIQFAKIALDSANTGDTSVLAAGAGVSINFNLAPTADGRWRMVTFGIPVFATYDKGFGLDMGLTLGTLNNLVSFGIAAQMLKADDAGGPSTGLLAGDFSRENVYLLVGFGLNFGGGSIGTPEQQMKAGTAGNYGKPPGYVGF